MDERASGLGLVLGVLTLGSLTMYCILSALRTEAFGLSAQTYTDKWLVIDCHCGDDDNFSQAELYAEVTKGQKDMTALAISPPSPD